MERSLAKRVGYKVIWFASRVLFVVFHSLRCRGRKWVPEEGPVLVCCNHQSKLDPMIVGVCVERRMNYLARESLFRSTIGGSILRFVDGIPIDRDGMGLSGIKECLRRLKRGEMLLVFPEGTRTTDGEVGALKPGFCALARRSKAQILPAAFDGLFDSWPRSAPFPRHCDVSVTFGQPISVDQIQEMNDDELVEECRLRIIACHDDARSRRIFD